jgi:DNA-binding MarR family transcriptional regulator
MIRPVSAGVRPAAKRFHPPRLKWAHAVLQAPGSMNEIFFAAKRVFQSSMRMTRASLQGVAPGLTAARFDMMFALTYESCDHHKRNPGKVLQSMLRRKLGVTAPVVSRMVRSLEALGWVRRQRLLRGDQRQREVSLTDEGLACIRMAYKLLFRVAARIVYHAICWGKHRDPSARLIHMDTLEGYLRSLRAYCRDTARLYYAWGHPDD